MTSKLKILFTHTGVSLETASASAGSCFHFLLHMTIGPLDVPGGHDYTLNVCSPSWLGQNIQHEKTIWGRHLLIVERFDAALIRSSIEEKILKCDRPDWAQTASVLGHFFAWEYEDYVS